MPVSRLLAAVVAAAALAACGTSTPSPTPASQPTASASSPTAVPTEVEPSAPVATPSAGPSSAGAAPCSTADLKASHGIVEGAAGSRLTQVVIVSAVTCSIDLYPALGLRDADGSAIVGSPAAGPGRIDLMASAAYASTIRVSNWCAAEPAYPVQLEIRLGEAELPVTGSSFPEAGDLPPCNGPGVVNPLLEGSAWAPSTPTP